MQHSYLPSARWKSVLRKALLKPIVYGLVHSEPAAAIIAELIDPRRSLDRFKGPLLDMMSELVGMNVRSYVRPGATKALLREIQDSQIWRNGIVHTGAQRAATDAERTIGTASATHTLFRMVVDSLGMHLHGGVEVCNQNACRSKP